MATSKKYCKSFFRRCTFSFPHIQKKGKGPLIWIHAVSVGETHAISTLVRKLRETMDTPTIVISSITEAGFATQEKIREVDCHLFLPFDFFFLVRKAIRRCTPDIVILSETDLWYRFLLRAKKSGAVIAIVNGKISERSYKRFKKMLFFSKMLFSLIDTLCVQTEEMKKRFCDLGIPASKLFVTGNLKSDFPLILLSSEEKEALKKRLHVRSCDRVVVVGSTHENEEEMIVAAIAPLLGKDHSLKVIIAPRHPERFGHVADLLRKQGHSFYLWSGGRFIGKQPFQIILVDVMGLLRSCYQIADVAIVAGSFTKHVGGHNILEPAAYGIPTICGPYMHSQQFLLDHARQYNALCQVDYNQLSHAVSSLLSDVKKYSTARENALAMMSASRGATDKTIAVLCRHMPEFFLQQKEQKESL